MRYIVSGEFTKITETSGTIQNTSKINVVEVSDTNEKGSGIMLYPLDRFTFSKSIYARCVDGGGAEVRVVPFEVDSQGGGEQGTTPSGGSSGIAFAGMILGTESSTVDGGLWFEVVDGLPIVKMNYGGSTFALGAKPTDGALIGDKLYLGGHEFRLTGFASGLTFSDNNFYAAGNSAPIGSVSDFAFQFTEAATLSVAEGGTIAITQLDTDVVDFSFDILGTNPLPPPTVVISYIKQGETDPTVHSCTFTNAAATVSLGSLGWLYLALITDSSGNVNITSTPENAAAIISTGATADKYDFTTSGIYPDPLPTAITSMQNPVWRIVTFGCPDFSDANCFGDFTFVINATDTHSSATITLNITGVNI